ncbi:hypothetical protein [Actibacterium sp. 188UL27-1]|uniref:hypothetical protein n=1 Tax=Actibacterium sp. 188UL27-1 TaxID=2786961 RepID=UPI00195EC68E|nr:hypothetical protein [Actibacterium sp. 188UL27-1]MBM7068359.1 hypothetical protein [Actibacterium sp. 188UL27-1]
MKRVCLAVLSLAIMSSPICLSALEKSDGPLRDAFRLSLAEEVGVFEEIIPSVLETARVLLEYRCHKQATLYATKKVKDRAANSPGSTEFFQQINAEVEYLMADAVDYVLAARKIRLAKY